MRITAEATVTVVFEYPDYFDEAEAKAHVEQHLTMTPDLGREGCHVVTKDDSIDELEVMGPSDG